MNIDTSNLDYMQTILKLTGLSDKQPVGFPGRSFTELLKGRMEKWFCTYSDPAIDGVRSAVNGSGQLCRQRFTVRQLWHFRGKNQIFFAAMTCPESFSNRPPSVLTGCHVIIFLKEPDIAPDVGVADFLADRLDRISSVGQQREGTFRAVAV